MIPQIGFAEMIVLALLAIIVVGPKDLPVLMRKMGQMMAKVRGMGQEFKDAFADMESETEMSELRKEIEELKNLGKFTDDDLSSEMRELDSVVRDATDFSSPKTALPQVDTPKTETVKPKAPKTKAKTAKTKTSKAKPKTAKPKTAKSKTTKAKAKPKTAAKKS